MQKSIHATLCQENVYNYVVYFIVGSVSSKVYSPLLQHHLNHILNRHCTPQQIVENQKCVWLCWQ